MATPKLHLRSAALLLLILLTACFRLLNTEATHSPLINFTPVGAMALFSGCYLQSRWQAYYLPLIALWFSDVLLNRLFYFDTWVLFYSGFAWVYGSFLLMVLLGQAMRRVNVKNVVLGAVSAALIHWLVSDFGVWLGGGTDITTGQPYPLDLAGLIKCYYLALPFMRNMLLANLLYWAMLFGGFEWLQHRYVALRPQAA